MTAVTDPILRPYDPHECDEHGVPLDWDSCRQCDQRRSIAASGMNTSSWCSVCHGHGSLRSAALEYLAAKPRNPVPPSSGADRFAARCEDCSHPAGHIDWEIPLGRDAIPNGALPNDPLLDDESIRTLLAKPYSSFHAWADRHGARPWTPCDGGCTHDAPLARWWIPGVGEEAPGWTSGTLTLDGDAGQVGRYIARVAGHDQIQAPWKTVRARPLGWPSDLRIERLAALCTACWGARVDAAAGRRAPLTSASA